MEADKVLVVEDEKDTRYILEKLLAKNNFEVACATNGSEAIEKLKTFKPKVILADWTMPVMDGLELCRILKEDENFKMIDYIILTARASLNDRVTGLDLGADDFLVKPIENKELLARIRTGIRVFNLQTELKKVEHSNAIIQMACTIGHKLNNPLSSLILSLKNIEDELIKKKDIAYNDDLLIINQSIERIKALINDLIKLQDPQ